jgi:hypothetical protein
MFRSQRLGEGAAGPSRCRRQWTADGRDWFNQLRVYGLLKGPGEQVMVVAAKYYPLIWLQTPDGELFARNCDLDGEYLDELVFCDAHDSCFDSQRN